MWRWQYSFLTTSEQKGHNEITTKKHILQLRQVEVDSLCYKYCILNMESILWHLTKCFYSSLPCILNIAWSHEYAICYFPGIIERSMENLNILKRARMWNIKLQSHIYTSSSWCYSDFTQISTSHILKNVLKSGWRSSGSSESNISILCECT